jgi:hypothetical protein
MAGNKFTEILTEDKTRVQENVYYVLAIDI